MFRNYANSFQKYFPLPLLFTSKNDFQLALQLALFEMNFLILPSSLKHKLQSSVEYPLALPIRFCNTTEGIMRLFIVGRFKIIPCLANIHSNEMIFLIGCHYFFSISSLRERIYSVVFLHSIIYRFLLDESGSPLILSRI
jgi:hypothetical protein